MAKIGRNDACPCGSGLKYKRCCLQKDKAEESAASPMQQLRLSLMAEIEKIQRAAKQGEEIVRELGVFVLWSNSDGDAWLMEISESDTVQVAKNGDPMDFPIADKAESCLETAPTQRINAAIRRIRKKYSQEVLSQVHVEPTETE